MKTEKIYLNDQLYAFEICNVYISPKKVSELLSSVEGVSGIKTRKAFSSQSNDIRVSFELDSVKCCVQEPYGDSSDYWIGPVDEKDVLDMTSINRVFEEYIPPYWRRLLGGLVMMDLRVVFGGTA